MSEMQRKYPTYKHGLTRSTLQRILDWGKYLSGERGWTKRDSQVYALVEEEIRKESRFQHKRAKERKDANKKDDGNSNSSKSV